MTDPPYQDVTGLLNAVVDGNSEAASALLPLVYEELRRLAVHRMRNEPAGHTLQATALVHEAYLRLVGDGDAGWDHRGHFFAAAAEAMRRILIERARRVGRLKHGGDRKRLPLQEGDAVDPGDADADDLLALDAALDRLAEADPERARVVMLRYFAGLTIDQTADAMGISPKSVTRHWTCARAWLHLEVSRDSGTNPKTP